MVMKMSGLVYNIMLAAAISYYFTEVVDAKT